jgi:predicted molibdopterin-dependent oxidoreductase YjgC
MGFNRHPTGVNGSRDMANLSVLTGRCGQANVQGCSDIQDRHNILPRHHGIKNPEHQVRFEKARGVPKLLEDDFLTLADMEDEAVNGKIKAIYIMGESPVGSDPETALQSVCESALKLMLFPDEGEREFCPLQVNGSRTDGSAPWPAVGHSPDTGGCCGPRFGEFSN